jgi:urate oxidase
LGSILHHNSYGKSSVRLTKVMRGPQRHEFIEMSVDILLEGDFVASYSHGDNRKVIATDSMKNTVYVLAAESKFDSIEQFALLLCRHFRTTYPQVTKAEVAIEQASWDRIEAGDRPHSHAFVSGRSEKRICRAALDSKPQISGGIAGLQVLKTTGSEFSGFVSDRYRTLKDASDRIFATSVEAQWKYSKEKADFNVSFDTIRAALLNTFAAHHSLSVQQTLLEMGKAALEAAPAIDSIELKLPNQHRIPFNLEPFGLKNTLELFVPTDEPYGLIAGVVKRE